MSRLRTTVTPTLADDAPYTMRLPDGRTLFVNVPGKWAEADASGETMFTPAGVRFLDQVRALAMAAPTAPTPGYIRSLRKALGLTLEKFAHRVGVEKMTVWRWEHGQLHPSEASVKALESLRRQASRKGVLLAG